VLPYDFTRNSMGNYKRAIREGDRANRTVLEMS
jgi:hypothetical protein